MPYIDLSHTLENGMTVYPGSAAPSFSPIATTAAAGYNEIRMDMSTHTGTHIDCGFHMLEAGRSILDYPLDQFYGNAVMIDCRYVAPGERITLDLLKPWESAINQSRFVLLCTGWSRYWGLPEYFRDFPVLDIAAARYLSSFSIAGAGTDAISFDPVGADDFANHHILLSNGKILIENLTRLEHLPHTGFIFSCFPLPLVNGDGSPVRAVAIV
jgi:kynurenine formamidase